MTTVNDRKDARADGEAPLSTEEIFSAHENGKLGVEVTSPLTTPRDLSIAYTPGVAQVSRAIAAYEARSPLVPAGPCGCPSRGRPFPD